MQAPRHAERALPAPALRLPAPPAGTIAGYAALFDRVDAQSDVIAPGAFARSLERHARAGTAPAMLWQHEACEPIGRWHAIREDRSGLHVSGALVLDTRRGREAAALMRAGALTGLSIGYVAVESHRDRGRGVRVLTEIELIEVSPVTFPAQPLARITLAGQPFRDEALWAAFRRARAALALPERRYVAPRPAVRGPGDHWRTQPRLPRGHPDGGQWTDEGAGGSAVVPIAGRGRRLPGGDGRAPVPIDPARSYEALRDLVRDLLGLSAGEPHTPRIDRDGFLDLEEGGTHGAHTIVRHVRVTDAQLARRFARDPWIEGSSRWTDQATAERSIRRILADPRIQEEVRAWLRSGRHNLTLRPDLGEVVGVGFSGPGSKLVGKTGAVLRLIRDGRGGFRILTAYPK